MKIKLAEIKDFDDYYRLKSDDTNIYWTGWSNKPNYENIKKFFIETINNLKTIKDRRIYLAYEDNNVVGYIYLDYVDKDTFALSPAISCDCQGKGYGKLIIGLGIEEGLKLGFKNMEAYVREDNIASQKCFEYNNAHKTDIYKNQYIENKKQEIKMIKYFYQSK